MLTGPRVFLRRTAAVALALASFAAGTLLSGVLRRAGLLECLFGGTRTERSVIEVLRTEELMFLVTTRVTTLACVEIHENDAILGSREGLLLATVRIYYGIDFQALSEDSVIRTDGCVTIRMPDPSILDLSTDLSTVRFFDKRSGLQVISDIVTGRDQEAELLGMLDSTASRWAAEQGLLPGREEILARLNNLAPMLAGYAGVESVRFE